MEERRLHLLKYWDEGRRRVEERRMLLLEYWDEGRRRVEERRMRLLEYWDEGRRRVEERRMRLLEYWDEGRRRVEERRMRLLEYWDCALSARTLFILLPFMMDVYYNQCLIFFNSSSVSFSCFCIYLLKVFTCRYVHYIYMLT